MNRKAQAADTFIVMLVALIIFVAVTYLFTYGIHIVTTRGGHHTGIVTAVEDNGIFFKTTTVYFKTDTRTSQEDQYCVIDQSIRQQLDNARQNQETVTIEYISYFHSGYKYCNGEQAIITGVSK